MSRSVRAQIAKETVEIAERGWYASVTGSRVEFGEAMSRCLQATKLYRPSDLQELLNPTPRLPLVEETQFEVGNETTLSATRRLVVERGLSKTLCLNFASAKNPGGGFLGGSQAQEESLARSSGLYSSLTSQWAYYEANRACGTALYTDHMILSPDVPVFRDDTGQLLDAPYLLSILTAPAVNAGAVQSNEPEQLSLIAPTMTERIAKLLAVAAHHGYEHLVLGAWGCGVFRNDPVEVAGMFSAALGENGDFGNRFGSVVFAVLDHSENKAVVAPFQRRFGINKWNEKT
jgi:uncharacterized protein (TIGR02452 family)